jgi:hypothetical protein
MAPTRALQIALLPAGCALLFLENRNHTAGPGLLAGSAQTSNFALRMALRPRARWKKNREYSPHNTKCDIYLKYSKMFLQPTIKPPSNPTPVSSREGHRPVSAVSLSFFIYVHIAHSLPLWLVFSLLTSLLSFS